MTIIRKNSNIEEGSRDPVEGGRRSTFGTNKVKPRRSRRGGGEVVKTVSRAINWNPSRGVPTKERERGGGCNGTSPYREEGTLYGERARSTKVQGTGYRAGNPRRRTGTGYKDTRVMGNYQPESRANHRGPFFFFFLFSHSGQIY